MSFGLEVGLLADLKNGDREGYASLRKQLATVNLVLRERGIREHREPKSLEYPSYIHTETSLGYSHWHCLRRFASHVALGRPLPSQGDKNAHTDPVLEEYIARFRNGEQLKYQHLIVHSDAEGFYVPIDFERVIETTKHPLTGGMLGSTQRLQAECRELAEILNRLNQSAVVPASGWTRLFAKWQDFQAPKTHAWEKFACERLIAACEASLLSKAAICFDG